jgi:CheY-like chemotaxis protein
MRRKRALIVDDSETARAVLAGKLRKFEIDVDTCASAAAAIDYLYERSPDAIFLDYEMPGMDGFQALKVIKSNPDTATIPVMMYTSREGGLELSQARALGAVGVLPKQLEPQDLSAVVDALRLRKEHDSVGRGQSAVVADLTARLQAAQPDSEVDEAPQVSFDTSLGLREEEIYSDVEYQLKRVATLIRKEIGKSEKHLMEFVGRELSGIRSDLYTVGQSDLGRGSSRWGELLTGFLLMLMIFIMAGFWIKDLMSENQQLYGRLAQLEENLGAVYQEVDQINQLVVEKGVMADEPLMSKTLSDKTLMPMKRLLEWAVNQGPGFGYGENPFNEARVLWLSELVKRLSEAGFTGKVTLKANLGDFCLVKDAVGGLVLAEGEMGMADCLFSSQLEQGRGLYAGEQSLGFTNYINSLNPENGDLIEVQVDNQPGFRSLAPYPDRYTVKTAGEWNLAAARNQRILVSLSHPDWQE